MLTIAFFPNILLGQFKANSSQEVFMETLAFDPNILLGQFQANFSEELLMLKLAVLFRYFLPKHRNLLARRRNASIVV